MAKQENYIKVAGMTNEFGKTYYFAIYEDGTDYQPGDKVLFSGTTGVNKISEIITPEQYKEIRKAEMTAEVICKVDTTAYDERFAKRERKANLKNMLVQKRKQLEEVYADEFYASKDEGYAKMLEEYNSL